MHPRDKTTPRIRGSTPEIEKAAREMRRRLTPAERVLWNALMRGRLDGLAFRCQHPIGPFILDFYCPAYRLAIEVDGAVHDDLDQAIRDEARTEQLEAYSYRVLRFRNERVLENLPAVLRSTRQAIRSRAEEIRASQPGDPDE